MRISNPPPSESNLDRHSITRLLQSKLPIAVYPCATDQGPFDRDQHNSYWELPNLQFVKGMAPALQRYIAFAFMRLSRSDFLRAMDYDQPRELMEKLFKIRHRVWETATWVQIADYRLVRRSREKAQLIPAAALQPDDLVLPFKLIPCEVEVADTALYRITVSEGAGNFRVLFRGDPYENEQALQTALPDLYQSFRVP